MSTTAAVAYPEPRTNRAPYTKAPSLPAPVIAVPPRSRYFSVEIGSLAFTRTTISTPKLKGPVIIQGVTLKFRVGSEPPLHCVEIGWSKSPVTENQVSLTATKNWNTLCERVASSYTEPRAMVGFVHANTAGAAYTENYPFPLLIAEPEMHLVINYQHHGVANPPSTFVELNVLEGVSDAVAANFH